jgi:hypothetical protein
MKLLHRISLTLLTLTAFLTACGQAPTPTPPRVFKTLGNLEVTLDTAGEATAKLVNPQTRSSTPLPDNALGFTRKFSSSFDLEASNERYVSATFEIKNNSGKAINNLSFIAYHQGNINLGGTAVKNLVNFGGAAITDPSIAQGIYPVQSLKRVGAETVVDADNADFQGFTPTDAESIGNSAKTNQIIRAEDTPLEYGFIARNSTNTRTIGDGETGSVTLTLRFARPTDPNVTPYRFVMMFVITEDSVPRVTRGINETTFEAETRALNTGATELMLIGPDSETPSNYSLTTVRLENAKIGLEPTYLVKPALFMKEVQPNTINNDVNNTVSIKGLKFDTSTSFFIQSTKLEILNLTETEALVTVPKGFIPSKYGIMAANNKGERATLYPAITIAAGAAARELDVQDNPNSYLEGYVIDYATKLPIENAKISVPGLETTTTSDGYYLLRGVPTGSYAVKIEKFLQQYDPTTNQYVDIEAYETVYRNAVVPADATGTITLKLAALEPKTTDAYTIDASGGIVYAQDGAYLKIPPGALDKPTSIRFTHLRAAETLPELNQEGSYLAFAHLTPAGLVFKKPATLFLPLQAGVELKPNTPINILYFNTLQNAWVDDITSGKISRINNKHYLEYEINHFTWIGGGWYSDPVSGCVQDQNAKRLAGVTTNWGITDKNGVFHGTTTQSDIGRILDAYAIASDRSYIGSVSQYYSGEGSVEFTPCIQYKFEEPSINPLEVEIQKETEVSPFIAPSNPTPRAAPDNVIDDCTKEIYQLCTLDNTPILIGKKLKIISFDIKNFKNGHVQPETLEFYFEGKRIPFETKPLGGDIMRVYRVLTSPQRPDGIERHAVLKFKYKKPDKTLGIIERDQSIRSIAQLKTPNTAVNVLPDAFLDATGVATPYSVKVPQGTLRIYRASQLEDDGSVTINVPVEALDAKGNVIGDLDTMNEIYFSDPSAAPKTGKPPSAPFKNGIATIKLKIYPSTSPRSDDISRVLLNQVSVAAGASPLSSRPVQTRVSTVAQPFKVLPNEYSMIYSSDVAKKSPSAGAKSLSFWSQVGDFFTWDRISSAVGGVTQFALGFVPVLGGAIDCAKGAYALITQSDFDLVEVELGCVGMSVDAIMTAANIADGCVGCTAYLANKAIMIALKRINQISKAVEGWMTKAFLGLLERFRERGVFYAKEFIDRIGNLKFLKEMDDAGETVLLEKSDDIVGDLVKACTIGPRSRIITTRGSPDECLPQDAINLFAKAGTKIDGVISKQEFVDLTSDLSKTPGLDNVLKKIETAGVEANVKGAVAEMKAGSGLKNAGWTELRFPGSEEFVLGNGTKTAPDLFARDRDGILRVFEIKNDQSLTRPQETILKELAAQTNAIPSFISIVPQDSAFLNAMRRAGVDVFDSLGNFLNP